MPDAPDVRHLEFVGVSKSFGQVRAAGNINFSVGQGEIVAFLGPSGCGKSTLLNLIAGFEVPDQGEIRLRGRSLNQTPPNKRPTALVFQSYALFPHMNVVDNITYGPRVQGRSRADAELRAKECISLLKLDGLDKRYPGELSGGQCQRVALARALAVRPEILLLDEALGALDKNLREDMQVELSLLLRSLGMTAILVTHDQREAFAVADRIVLMRGGEIVQDGTPSELYRNPCNEFVLGFLGHINRVPVRIRNDNNGVVSVESDRGLRFQCSSLRLWAKGEKASLCLRSTDVSVSPEPTAVHIALPGTLRLGSFLGATQRYVVDLGELEVIMETSGGAKNAEGSHFRTGDRVFLSFDPASCFLAD